jgi:hypothetical protein
VSDAIFTWRIWAVKKRPYGVLCSQLDPNPFVVEWPPGHPLRAACAFHDHDAPDGGCRCGWRGQPSLDELIWWLRDWKHVTPMVLGGVILSGRIIRGDRAHKEIPGILRAEFAEVCGPLLVGPVKHDRENVVTLARNYGVAVRMSRYQDPRTWFSRAREELPGSPVS